MTVHISGSVARLSALAHFSIREGQIIFASDWRDFVHVNTAECLDATAAKQIR